MRESALTAGVDVTLPVIAQGWFCNSWRRVCESESRKDKLPNGSQSVKALWATRALRPPQRTVSHGETATGRRDSDATALRCGSVRRSMRAGLEKALQDVFGSRQESAGWGNGEIHA